MATDVRTIDDNGLGQGSDERFAEAAIAGAQSLIDEDPGQARWVTPLMRAVKRRRLRMPSLSPTVQRLVGLIESNEVDLDELAAAVNGDPVLATRIMGVANSSYFRGATQVPNVREALMRMGVREARTIVIVVALRTTVLRSPGLGSMAQTIWKHSLLTAAATQEIASELPPWEASGFLAGLLHDLGQLVVLAYASELPAWQEDGAGPSEAIVTAISEATHSPLGAMVLASWGFPDEFCRAVMRHHDPSGGAGAVRDLARALELGDRIAHQIEAGWPEDVADVPPGLVELADRLGLDADRLHDVAAEAAASFEALSKLA